MRIFDGPANVNGNARSVQLVQAAVVSVQLANKHLRDNGLVAQCDADTFLAAAETTLPAGFRERIGDFLYEETRLLGAEADGARCHCINAGRPCPSIAS